MAQQKDSSLEELLDVPSVAKILKISDVTVRRIISRGDLRSVRIGEKHLRVTPSALRAYVEAQGRGRTDVPHEGAATSNAALLAPVVRTGALQGGNSWTIIQAEALQGLQTLASQSVDCIVTSPPYYWQRDYGCEGQIGHEASIEAYVDSLSSVFLEARRVLKSTGLLFLNIGDTYYSAKGKPHGRDLKNAGRQMARQKLRAVDGPGLGLPRKSLIGIPWRVALKLQNDGWTLRSDIIWKRPGCLGEPTAKDRPWRAYEHIFMFSKGARYFFDRNGLNGEEDVWSFPARPDNPKYHFAPYPLELVARCLRVGCPPEGIVLDPFVGSGTTVVAALQSGRSGVGIDLNSQYCGFASEWAEQTASKLDHYTANPSLAAE